MITKAKAMPRKKGSIAKPPVVAHKSFSMTYGEVKASPSGWLDAAPELEETSMSDFETDVAAVVDQYRNKINKQWASKVLANAGEQAERDEGWIWDEVNTQPATPTLSALDPNTAVIGDADLVMTVTGADFNPTSIITFNGGNEPTTYVSATELSTTIKPATATTAGAYPVTVKTSTLESDPLDFTFTDPVTRSAKKSAADEDEDEDEDEGDETVAKKKSAKKSK
jgi:hypothetical protein